MSGLNDVLELLAKACSPTTDDHGKRIQLIEHTKTALQRLGIVEELQVIPYGSFVSGFYNSSSDLDLAICGRVSSKYLKPAALAEIFRGTPEESHVPLYKLDKRTRTQLLRDAASLLVKAGVAAREGMEYVLHARVPLIKFVDRRSGIAVDLCLGSVATPFKAWSVSQVASIHPAFGKLFRVVKVWAKAHAINDGAAHMFNSWCLTLVVMFFLQSSAQPPLLPPLHALLFDQQPDVETPRIMQGGEKDLPQLVFEVMARRAAQAAQLYGPLPCKPLAELFRDFVAECGRKLRALLASQEAFKRGTRMSPFFGQLLPSRPFANSYVLCVEDPYDDLDNTARTFGTWESNPGTIHYVTSVFERTLQHLDRELGPAAAAAAAAAAPSAPSLSSTVAFLFGPELLSRLPEQSAQLLGPQLDEWARGAVRAGRPAGEVHEAMLRQLGAAGEFVSFQSFKRRHNIKVFNEDKYLSPEEKAAAAAAEAARKAAKRAKATERRATKKAKEATGTRTVEATERTVEAAAAAEAAVAARAAVAGRQAQEAAPRPRSRRSTGTGEPSRPAADTLAPAAAGTAAAVGAAAAAAATAAAAAGPSRAPPRPVLTDDGRAKLQRALQRASAPRAASSGGVSEPGSAPPSRSGRDKAVSSVAAPAEAVSAAADSAAAALGGLASTAEPARSRRAVRRGGSGRGGGADRQPSPPPPPPRPAQPRPAEQAGAAGGPGQGQPAQPSSRSASQQESQRQAQQQQQRPASRRDRGGGNGGGGASSSASRSVEASMRGLALSRTRAWVAAAEDHGNVPAAANVSG